MAAGASTAAAVVVAGMAAAAVVAGGATVVAAGPGLEPPTGVGEDSLTLGQNLCPSYVFTMARLEKERRWRGWEEERFQK